MKNIRKLKKKEIHEAVRLIYNSYPAFGPYSPEKAGNLTEIFCKLQDSDDVQLWGYFEKNELIGCMRIHHYKMNYGLLTIDTGGVGLVSVSLLHKKQKICKKMIEFFLNYCALKNFAIAILYPFRPDFYKKMGFGYGSQIHHFEFSPGVLPPNRKTENLKQKKCFEISEDEKLFSEIIDCYNRSIKFVHGALIKTERDFSSSWINKQHNGLSCIYYEEGGRIKGYIIFKFTGDKNGNFLQNDIVLKEFIYESRTVFNELLAFLYTQLDQIRHVVYNTFQENFYYLLGDIRDASKTLHDPAYHQTHSSGTGLMYRITDFKLFLKKIEEHNFNDFQGTVKFVISDSMVDYNSDGFIVKFSQGRVSLVEKTDYDVQITIDISCLSSLMMGSVSLYDLYRLNLCEVSEPDRVYELDKVFKFAQKPVCYTNF